MEGRRRPGAARGPVAVGVGAAGRAGRHQFQSVQAVQRRGSAAAPLALDREPDPGSSGGRRIPRRLRRLGRRRARHPVDRAPARPGPRGPGRLLRRGGPADRRGLGPDRTAARQSHHLQSDDQRGFHGAPVPRGRPGDRRPGRPSRAARRPGRGASDLGRGGGQGADGAERPQRHPVLDQSRLSAAGGAPARRTGRGLGSNGEPRAWRPFQRDRRGEERPRWRGLSGRDLSGSHSWRSPSRRRRSGSSRPGERRR